MTYVQANNHALRGQNQSNIVQNSQKPTKTIFLHTFCKKQERDSQPPHLNVTMSSLWVQKPQHQQNKRPKTTKTGKLKTKPHPNSENNTHIYMSTPPILKTILDTHN